MPVVCWGDPVQYEKKSFQMIHILMFNSIVKRVLSLFSTYCLGDFLVESFIRSLFQLMQKGRTFLLPFSQVVWATFSFLLFSWSQIILLRLNRNTLHLSLCMSLVACLCVGLSRGFLFYECGNQPLSFFKQGTQQIHGWHSGGCWRHWSPEKDFATFVAAHYCDEFILVLLLDWEYERIPLVQPR